MNAFTTVHDLDPSSVGRAALVAVAVPTGEAVVAVALRSGRDRWRLDSASSAPVAGRSTLGVDDAQSYAGVDPGSGQVLWRRATQYRPLLGADPDGMNDCC